MVVVPYVKHAVPGSVIKPEVIMDLELELTIKALKEASYPHITRRLIQDHLGHQWYVNRIEITIMGEEFYHVKSEIKGEKDKLYVLLLTMLKHIKDGGVLNLEHWKRIEYTY